MKRKHVNKKDRLSVIVNLRMSPVLFKLLDEWAGEDGQSMSELMRTTLEVAALERKV